MRQLLDTAAAVYVAKRWIEWENAFSAGGSTPLCKHFMPYAINAGLHQYYPAPRDEVDALH
jgi:hypothetical protein